VPLYRDEAVVLRTQKLGEADRIVTLLTRRNGRVRAVAKGVRRTGSRLGSRVEPFTHVDLMLYTHAVEAKRGLDTVTQADTIAPYGERIAADYAAYTAGTAILETAERLTAEEREPTIRLFLLLVGALRALALAEHTPTSVLDAFVLRALALSGWEAALDGGRRGGLRRTPGGRRGERLPGRAGAVARATDRRLGGRRRRAACGATRGERHRGRLPAVAVGARAAVAAAGRARLTGRAAARRQAAVTGATGRSREVTAHAGCGTPSSPSTWR
jgi:hypothetical protein